MSLRYLFDPNIQFQGRGGVNNVNGFLRVFLNGTDDRATTYKNFSGTYNEPDIVLDTDGRAVVIVDDSYLYRIEVYNDLGGLLWTVSNYSARGGEGGSSTAVSVEGTEDEIDVDENTQGGIKHFVLSLSSTIKNAISTLGDNLSSIALAVNGKKDRQNPVFIESSNIKTVKTFSQDENGNISIEFDDIAFPDWTSAINSALLLCEQKENKKTTLVGYEGSNTYYPSIKAVVDFVNSALQNLGGKLITDNGNPFTSSSDLPSSTPYGGVTIADKDYAYVQGTGFAERWSATVTGSSVAWVNEYTINIPVFTPEQQAAIDSGVTAEMLGTFLTKTGDGSNVTAAFTAAGSRTNISTGEKLSVIFGKIAKWFSDLKAVAFSGSYSDLSNKPTIGSGTLTIQKNGTSVGTFGANQTGNTTANIAVPTKTSELTNDSNFLTTSGNGSDVTATFTAAGSRTNIATGEKLSVIFGKVAKWFADLKTVAFSGSYSDLSNKPTIPAAVAVKGNAESTYRTGNVNLTPANLGISATSTSVTVGDTTLDIDTISKLSRTVIGTSAVDLNTIVGDSTNKAFSVYGWSNSNRGNVSNKPTDNGGIMVVMSYSDKRVLQLVLNSSAGLWARLCYNSSSEWTPWVNLRDASWINSGTFDAARIPTSQPNLASDFTMASSRSNISTGEKLSIMFGKIAKFLNDLKTVAFTGAYSDLTGKPTIGSATLTIQKNGSNVATFGANATSNVTANIVVPTNTSELTNDSNFLTSSGNGSNVTSTFTKNASDTSGMTSGGKLSALFKAISDFFASIVSSLNNKAEKNGDYRNNGLQAAYSTQSGFANESTYAAKIGSSASHPAIGGYLKPIWVDSNGNLQECYDPSSWSVGQAAWANVARYIYSTEFGGCDKPSFINAVGQNNEAELANAFDIPHFVTRWHEELYYPSKTGFGIIHRTDKFYAPTTKYMHLGIEIANDNASFNLVLDGSSLTPWYGGQVWGTIKWDSQSGSNLNSAIARIGNSNITDSKTVLATRNISTSNQQDIQGHALFAICTGDFLRRYVVDMEISLIKPQAGSSVSYVSVVSKCYTVSPLV